MLGKYVIQAILGQIRTGNYMGKRIIFILTKNISILKKGYVFKKFMITNDGFLYHYNLLCKFTTTLRFSRANITKRYFSVSTGKGKFLKETSALTY